MQSPLRSPPAHEGGHVEAGLEHCLCEAVLAAHHDAVAAVTQLAAAGGGEGGGQWVSVGVGAGLEGWRGRMAGGRARRYRHTACSWGPRERGERGSAQPGSNAAQVGGRSPLRSRTRLGSAANPGQHLREPSSWCARRARAHVRVTNTPASSATPSPSWSRANAQDSRRGPGPPGGQGGAQRRPTRHVHASRQGRAGGGAARKGRRAPRRTRAFRRGGGRAGRSPASASGRHTSDDATACTSGPMWRRYACVQCQWGGTQEG